MAIYFIYEVNHTIWSTVLSLQYCSVILWHIIYHPVRQDIVLCRYVDYFVSDSIIVSAYCLSSEQWIRAVANSWLNKIGRVSLCIYIALYLNLKYKIWKWFFFMRISYYSFYCILLFEILYFNIRFILKMFFFHVLYKCYKLLNEFQIALHHPPYLSSHEQPRHCDGARLRTWGQVTAVHCYC